MRRQNPFRSGQSFPFDATPDETHRRAREAFLLSLSRAPLFFVTAVPTTNPNKITQEDLMRPFLYQDREKGEKILPVFSSQASAAFFIQNPPWADKPAGSGPSREQMGGFEMKPGRALPYLVDYAKKEFVVILDMESAAEMRLSLADLETALNIGGVTPIETPAPRQGP